MAALQKQVDDIRSRLDARLSTSDVRRRKAALKAARSHVGTSAKSERLTSTERIDAELKVARFLDGGGDAPDPG